MDTGTFIYRWFDIMYIEYILTYNHPHAKCDSTFSSIQPVSFFQRNLYSHRRLKNISFHPFSHFILCGSMYYKYFDSYSIVDYKLRGVQERQDILFCKKKLPMKLAGRYLNISFVHLKSNAHKNVFRYRFCFERVQRVTLYNK